MSAAWEGYREMRRPSRRRARRQRMALGLALLAAVAAGLVLAGAWPRRLLGQRAGAGPTTLPADNPAACAVVLYNKNDPASRDLAVYYAQKRGIDWEHVLALDCPNREDITREEYDTTIAAPVRAWFDERGWWNRTPDRPGTEPSSRVQSNRIRFLVLIRGVPLRIQPTANYPGDFSREPSPLKEQNAACVDSELAVLGLFTRMISGLVPNPVFRSFARFSEDGAPGVMYTGRLDAPTAAMVRRMIDDSLAVEKTGLWGRCYVDARGLNDPANPLAQGDQWMNKIAREIAPPVLPTVLDDQANQFPTAYPFEEAALYFGWYSQDPMGPFTREDVKFRPGAVACHIHSFSATSLRDPKKWWVAPLLAHGADAVLGNVYEPYLGLTTNLDLFAARLTDGYTFAESAWQATPGLSWMNTVVGDPLYRPGKVWKDLQSDLGGNPPTGQTALVTEAKAYYQGAQIWHDRGEAAGAAALEKSAARLRSALIYEGLAGYAAGAGDYPRAVRADEQAARLYRDPADKIRVAISEAAVLTKDGKIDQAAALLAAARSRYANHPAAAALDGP